MTTSLINRLLNGVYIINSKGKFHIRKLFAMLKKWLIQTYKIMSRKLNNISGKNHLSDEMIRDIPIIINNFNRLDCLKELIKRLEKAGYTNIRIIDNNSSYPPLIEYYKSSPYKIHYLEENLEFLALWRSSIFEEFYKESFYILTDPDVIPEDTCPNDFIHHFYHLLIKYPELDKVGFSLRIDDIPDYYDRKEKVLEIEKPYWHICKNGEYYKAPIDTTFALYRPGTKGGSELIAGRTLPPYRALHLPWYQDSDKPSAETLYYRNSAIYSKNWS